jgi:hypothetical protein
MLRALAGLSLSLSLLLGCWGCGGGKKSPANAATQPVAEGGKACSSHADCATGEMCAGPEGCETAWTCVKAQACTNDAVEYCSCGGETIHGSGTCPPAPYKHRGACP